MVSPLFPACFSLRCIVGKAPRVLLSISRRERERVSTKPASAPAAHSAVPLAAPADLPDGGLDAFTIPSQIARQQFVGFDHRRSAPLQEEGANSQLIHSATHYENMQELETRSQAMWGQSQTLGDKVWASTAQATVPLHLLTSTLHERSREEAGIRVLFLEGFISEEEYVRRLAEFKLAESKARAPVIPTANTIINSSPLNDSLSDPVERAIEARQIRVFVSSTFADMKEEREVLLNQVFPALNAICKSRGVQFSAVDLRWGITTDQSQQGETINICLREIERCRPYFVGVLGARYGWAQPVGGTRDALLECTFAAATARHDWLKEFQDRSITELEIRHAVLNRPTSSTTKRARFYFRNLSSEEEQLQDPRLASLKSEIANSVAPASKYSAAAELGSQVYADLLKLIDIDFPVTYASRVDSFYSIRSNFDLPLSFVLVATSPTLSPESGSIKTNSLSNARCRLSVAPLAFPRLMVCCGKWRCVPLGVRS